MNDYINLYAVYAANKHKDVESRTANEDDGKLWEEWLLNWGINPVASRYIYKRGLYGGNSRHALNDMKACRDFCRKMGVWFESEAEAYVFYDMGGENDDDDYREFADEVKSLRAWCKGKGHHWRNYRYSGNAEVSVGRERINNDAWFDVVYDDSTYVVI